MYEITVNMNNMPWSAHPADPRCLVCCSHLFIRWKFTTGDFVYVCMRHSKDAWMIAPSATNHNETATSAINTWTNNTFLKVDWRRVTCLSQHLNTLSWKKVQRMAERHFAFNDVTTKLQLHQSQYLVHRDTKVHADLSFSLPGWWI